MEDHRFKLLVVQNKVQGENIKMLVKQNEMQAAHIVMLEKKGACTKKKCAYNEEKSTL